MASRTSKMVQYINYRMRITVQDGRQLVGRFLAFDRHMNVVLGDTEEFRSIGGGSKKDGDAPRQERRVLGLVILRGENVVSITIEGPPQQEERPRKGVTATGMAVPPSLHGPGMGVSAGRGLAPPMMGAAPGLSGPARGVGGPAPAALRPQFGAPAMPYAGTGGPGMPPPMRPGMPPPMSQPPRPPGPPPM